MAENNICFHCGGKLIWQADFTYEEYEIENVDGLIHVLTCSDCGAHVEYYIDCEEYDDVDETEIEENEKGGA